MVPLSERRHRIYESEIPEVVAGLKLRLQQLLKKRQDRVKAETTFRALYRLMRDQPGRPKYPEFDWNNVEYFLDYYHGESKIEAC